MMPSIATKIRWVAIIFGGVCALFHRTALAQAPIPLGEIVYAGTIADPSGKPVEGAKIFICFWHRLPLSAVTPHWDPIAVTDAQGQFRFTGQQLRDYGMNTELKDGLYANTGSYSASLCAVKAGYALTWTYFAKFDSSGLSYKLRLERQAKLPADAREQTEKEFGSLEQRFKFSDEPLQLKPDDCPVEGKILNINGDPVAGAKVSLIEVRTGADGTLNRWHEAIKADRADFYSTNRSVPLELRRPRVQSLLAPVTTNAHGVFVFPGLGSNRLVELQIEGPGIQTDRILVRTEPGDRIEIPKEFSRSGDSLVYYPSQFVHVVGPSQPIVGTVVDQATGQPIAGAVVLSQTRHGVGTSGSGQDFIRTTTDAEGRYRLEGMPIGDTNRLGVIPPKDTPYLSDNKSAKTRSDFQPLTVDFRLFSGVWVSGRVTDKQTGKGLPGIISVFTFVDFPAAKRGWVDEREYLRTDDEGRFRVVVARGRGIIACSVDEHKKYPRGRGAEKIGGAMRVGTMDEHFRTGPSSCMPSSFHILAELDPPSDTDEIQLDLVLDSGQNIKGRVIDQTDQPVTTAVYAGRLNAFEGSWDLANENGDFEIVGYEADKPRRITAFDRQRNLAATATISGPLTEPVVLKLQPAGAARGRVVDADGEPLSDLQLSKWDPPSNSPEVADPYSSSLPVPPADITRNRFVICTDSKGVFELNRLVPGKEYRIRTIGRSPGQANRLRVYGPLDVVIKVEPGQVLDLGDVKIANEREFTERFRREMKESSPSSKNSK